MIIIMYDESQSTIPDSRHPESCMGLVQVVGAVGQLVCVGEQAVLAQIAPLHPGKRYLPAF